MEKSLYEKLGGSYTKVGDYLLPNLMIDENEQRLLGKYGRLRKRYLKEHRRVLYTNLLVSDKLGHHLAAIDETCEERMELLSGQMARQERVTEELKAADQMEWVRHMNSIRNRAEEVVLHDLVYCWGGAKILILEDLYLGDVRPSERSFKRNSQYAKALDEVVKARDALTDTLTEKQKEVFEDYMTAQREVNVLTDCETFIYAFRLAAKIMIDVLTNGTMKEI